MALNGTTLHVAVETFTTTIGGLTKTVKQGDVYLGSMLPARAEPLSDRARQQAGRHATSRSARSVTETMSKPDRS
jgi:hypothetical protein